MLAIFYLGVPLLKSGPGFTLQVLGAPKSAPVGFPLQSLTRVRASLLPPGFKPKQPIASSLHPLVQASAWTLFI